MRITTRLTIISAGTLAALVILLPVLIQSFTDFREAKANYLLADQIHDSFVTRTTTNDQYLLYRETRAEVLWEQQKDTTNRLVSQARSQFHRKDDLDQLNHLSRHFDEITAIFRRIVENTPRLQEVGDNRSIYEELDKRLVSQLLLKATEVREAALALQGANEHRIDQAYQRLTVILGLFAASLATITILTSWQIGRSIRRRLGPLHAGVKSVADGDLGFRLKVVGADELSELAQSINAMTEKLQISTRQLEEEIGKRLTLAAQQESETRFRAWFDLPLIGICITSPTKGWIEVNDHACTLMGYGRAELAGKTWAELTHPDDLQVDAGQFERVLRGEIEGYSLEKRFIRKNGEVMPAELAVRCVRLADGSVDYFVALIHDITERKAALEALRKEREMAERYLRVAEVMFVAFDTEAHITLLNRKGYSILGYEEGELMGQDWFRVCLPPEEYNTVFGVYKRLLSGDLAPVERFENHIVRKDGEKRLISWHNTMLKDDEGRIIGTLSSGEDITDLKLAEAERENLQAQLQQAQKMDSLGSLAGGVAHDMNNVLGAILGLASAHLEIQPAASPAYRAFDTITKAANRGRDLVKGLLGFARRGLAEACELDLNEILCEEVHILERTTLSKVRLELDLTQGLRPIRGDASALTHAFMNLCVNAVDAMPEQGTLTLRTRNVDNDWVEVRVEDSGHGMTKEVLARAMDPFFTTKGVGKGTGLGLPLVYSTVKAHRGQMDIQSEPGRGTSVRLRFPSCAQAPNALECALVKEAEPTERTLKILLVDDDDLIQSSTQILLEVMGHATTTASSGEEALAMLETGFHPDVVILDMNMPGLGGAGTLPRLRALRPDLTVLLATGRVDQAALNLVEGDPKVFMMPKPYSKDELRQSLEAIGRE